MAGMEHRYRGLWLHERSEQGRVLGSFHPLYCVSWHDHTLGAREAFETLLHEELHAVAMAGTFLHLSLLRDYVLAVPGSHEIPPALSDHVTLHESLPKAHDVLFGSRTSHYKSPPMIQAAASAARAVRRFCELVAPDIQEEGYTGAVLQGLYLAIGDAYNHPARYSGAELLGLAESAVRENAARLRDTRFVAGHGVREQARNVFADLLQEKGVRVVNMSTPYLAHQTYYLLANLALRNPHASMMHPILPSLVALWFNGPFALHLVFDHERKTANLVTTLHGVLEALRANGVRDSSRLHRTEAASQREMYRSPFDYVYRGYLHKCLTDVTRLPDGALGAYLNTAFGAFPSTLINLLDLFIPPGAEYPEKERVERAMLDDDPAYGAILRDYDAIRRLIWKQLCAAAPQAVETIVGVALRCIQQLSDRGEVPWPFDIRGVVVNVGGRQAFKIAG